jgi:hypothetical protein
VEILVWFPLDSSTHAQQAILDRFSAWLGERFRSDRLSLSRRRSSHSYSGHVLAEEILVVLWRATLRWRLDRPRRS